MKEPSMSSYCCRALAALGFVLLGLPVAQAGPVTLTTHGSVSPAWVTPDGSSFGASPSITAWQQNAISAIRQGLPALGGEPSTMPSAYQERTHFHYAEVIQSYYPEAAVFNLGFHS